MHTDHRFSAAAAQTPPRGFGTLLTGVLRGGLARFAVLRGLRARRLSRRDAVHITALSERELKDIGLSRTDAVALANGYWPAELPAEGSRPP